MRPLITLLLVFGLVGCATLEPAPTKEELRYQRWYRHLTYEERQVEDQKQLARMQAAGMVLQGMALRGGPLGSMPIPPPYVYQPLPTPQVAPITIRPSGACVTMPSGNVFYTDC